MKSKNKMLMRELRDIDPLNAEVSPEDLATDDALLRRILTADPNQGADFDSGDGRRRARPRWVIAPAVVALALIAAVALLGGSGDEGGSLAPLNEVAAAAASQAPPPASAIRYSKVRFTSLDTAIAGGEAWSVYKSELREEWRSESEPGRLRVVGSPPQFVGPGDEAAWEAAGRPSFVAADSGATTERKLPPESEAGDQAVDVSKLPLDPTALIQVVSQRADQIDNSAPRQVRTLLLIGELLQSPAAAPDLRAALYRAAERIPGIQYFGETQDQLGRTGEAIGMESSYSGGPTRYELIWDPKTTDVLSTTAVSLEPVQFADASPPFPLEATLFIESRP